MSISSIDPVAASRIANLEAEKQNLVTVLEKAEARLSACASIFNHPSFTDRGNDGPRCSSLVAEIRAVVKQSREA